MGEFMVEGSLGTEFLQYLTTNDVGRLQDGQAQYSALAYPEGTVVDDLLVYRIDATHYVLVVNAANIEKDLTWLGRHNRFGALLRDLSDRTALLAVQGPLASASIQAISEAQPGDLASYHFTSTRLAGVEGILSRTGYTGEDGFEFYCPSTQAPVVWDALLDAGPAPRPQPAGLGARNTLRLEARLLLYGNDIDESTTLIEAGLGWIVKLDKADFIGRESLAVETEAGVRRTLARFEMLGREIARERYPVLVDGQGVGCVSSGGPSITLKKNIGLSYLPVGHSSPGARFEIQVRQRLCPAQVVPTPFYSRST
jgi:aminomethyltransferase